MGFVSPKMPATIFYMYKLNNIIMTDCRKNVIYVWYQNNMTPLYAYDVLIDNNIISN